MALLNKKSHDAADNQVIMSGLKDSSRQGDSAVRYIFSMLGVKTTFAEKNALKPTDVTLSAHHRALPRFDFDLVGQPDLAQTVVVTTVLMGIPFRFGGLQTLRIKETDRIAALKTEMRKLGYVLDDSVEGELSWDGTRCEAMPEPVIDTYDDHRMAMAFAPAAIMFPGMRMNNPEVVTKSYPEFWDELRKAGFSITEA
jgi:3-phosphoshikimate 1-carboxyvinyltransferase